MRALRFIISMGCVLTGAFHLAGLLTGIPLVSALLFLAGAVIGMQQVFRGREFDLFVDIVVKLRTMYPTEFATLFQHASQVDVPERVRF